MRETGRNRQMAQERVMALREQKDKLSADIDYLETDEGKEKFFRENFGVAKEGEGVIIVVEEKKQPVPPKSSSFSSFFSFLRNLFK